MRQIENNFLVLRLFFSYSETIASLICRNFATDKINYLLIHKQQ